LKRCQWVDLSSEIYVKYHDEEWGIAVYDDQKLFEMLILEGAQAGLSWLTILTKRENYRQAFDNWQIDKIASYDEKKVAELLLNPGIIRNKLKIQSTIKNAKIFLEIQEEFGSFSKYLWHFIEHDADKISKDLKKRGMKFVGPTIIYAFMQAVGVVNDHDKGCFKR
jgi:DNA-3-methyladenine glycosylase I